MDAELTKLLADMQVLLQKTKHHEMPAFMDKTMQIFAQKMVADRERCYDLMQNPQYYTPEQRPKFDKTYALLQLRTQRVSTCADILAGRTYTIVEGKDKQPYVQKGDDPKLIALAEKLGLRVETQSGMELKP